MILLSSRLATAPRGFLYRRVNPQLYYYLLFIYSTGINQEEEENEAISKCTASNCFKRFKGTDLFLEKNHYC